MNTFMEALKDEQKRILRMIDLMDQSADLPPLVRATASHTRPSSVRSNPQPATSRPALSTWAMVTRFAFGVADEVSWVSCCSSRIDKST